MATKAEKKATVEEIVGQLQNAGAVYITDYTGMNVSLMNNLRSKFFEKEVTYKVYKNKLMKRAMEEVGG
jgi:large subunit ribosomal protein L10